jgi:hypothetical protein
MILPKGHQNARNDRGARTARLYHRHVKTRMTTLEARSMSRKPRKFTCLGSTLGQPRASWGLKRPQGKHVKTRVWDPSWAILGPPGASWRLLGAILVYLRASWGCPGASKGPRHVKTRVRNAISQDFNACSRHSTFSRASSKPQARENTCLTRYFTRCSRIYISIHVFQSILQAPGT